MRKLLLATAMTVSFMVPAWGQMPDPQIAAVLRVAPCNDFLTAAAEILELVINDDQSPTTEKKLVGLMRMMAVLYHINHKNGTMDVPELMVYLMKLVTKCEALPAGTSIYEVARRVP